MKSEILQQRKLNESYRDEDLIKTAETILLNNNY